MEFSKIIDFFEYHGIVASTSYAEAMSQLEDLYELKLSSLRDGGIVFLPELPNVIVEANIC